MQRVKPFAAPYVLCFERQLTAATCRSSRKVFSFAKGNVVLARFTAMTNKVARYVDSLGRVGGTEFLLLLPDTTLDNARVAAERLRGIVARRPLPELPADERITCSIGITQYVPEEELLTLLQRAKSGLNLAKTSGRNRVIALGADGLPIADGG